VILDYAVISCEGKNSDGYVNGLWTIEEHGGLKCCAFNGGQDTTQAGCGRTN